jgi:hypothetical protein
MSVCGIHGSEPGPEVYLHPLLEFPSTDRLAQWDMEQRREGTNVLLPEDSQRRAQVAEDIFGRAMADRERR